MKIQNHNVQTDNPLGSAPVGGLILKFSVPAIISMLVSALYNIVDQIFIGQGVGMLGNAATNVAFPVTIFLLPLLFFWGSEAPPAIIWNQAQDMTKSQLYCRRQSFYAWNQRYPDLCGSSSVPWSSPASFGGTPDVMPYAIDYTGITAVGIPFYILTTGGCHLIRADRSPGFLWPACWQALWSILYLTLFLFLASDGASKAEPGPQWSVRQYPVFL